MLRCYLLPCALHRMWGPLKKQENSSRYPHSHICVTFFVPLPLSHNAKNTINIHELIRLGSLIPTVLHPTRPIRGSSHLFSIPKRFHILKQRNALPPPTESRKKLNIFLSFSISNYAIALHHFGAGQWERKGKTTCDCHLADNFVLFAHRQKKREDMN